MFKGRPPVEVMILVFTFVIAFAIIATGATIAVVEIRDPSVDTTKVQDLLFNLISGIVGALLGLLAGQNNQPPPPPNGPAPRAQRKSAS
jgi:uncharacterized membrane protein HdeD (DUF308 family)